MSIQEMSSWGGDIYSRYGTYTNSANNIYDVAYSSIAPSLNYNTGYGVAQDNGYTIAYYVEEYINRLGIEGTGRLLTYPEANAMTISQRTNGAYYWLGSASSSDYVWNVYSDGRLSNYSFNTVNYNGVRPVIVVSTSDIGA